jgi:hypothetical protein
MKIQNSSKTAAKRLIPKQATSLQFSFTHILLPLPCQPRRRELIARPRRPFSSFALARHARVAPPHDSTLIGVPFNSLFQEYIKFARAWLNYCAPKRNAARRIALPEDLLHTGLACCYLPIQRQVVAAAVRRSSAAEIVLKRDRGGMICIWPFLLTT